MFGPPMLLRLFGFSYAPTEKPIEEKPIEEKPPEEKKLKPCCACPETKRARDACIVENGQENCTDLIEAHRECMKKMGFNI